jgi:hypothetical protein
VVYLNLFRLYAPHDLAIVFVKDRAAENIRLSTWIGINGLLRVHYGLCINGTRNELRLQRNRMDRSIQK